MSTFSAPNGRHCEAIVSKLDKCYRGEIRCKYHLTSCETINLPGIHRQVLSPPPPYGWDPCSPGKPCYCFRLRLARSSSATPRRSRGKSLSWWWAWGTHHLEGWSAFERQRGKGSQRQFCQLSCCFTPAKICKYTSSRSNTLSGLTDAHFTFLCHLQQWLEKGSSSEREKYL